MIIFAVETFFFLVCFLRNKKQMLEAIIDHTFFFLFLLISFNIFFGKTHYTTLITARHELERTVCVSVQ